MSKAWQRDSSRFRSGIADYTQADTVVAKSLYVLDSQTGGGGGGGGGGGMGTDVSYLQIGAPLGNYPINQQGTGNYPTMDKLLLTIDGETASEGAVHIDWGKAYTNDFSVPCPISSFLEQSSKFFAFGLSVSPKARETRGFALGDSDYPYNGSSGNNGIVFATRQHDGTDVSANYYNRDNLGIPRAGVTVPGQFWAADCSFGTVVADTFTARSDARVKANIETISGALETVESLRGTTFNLTNVAGNPKRMGFIAQEVSGNAPDLVVNTGSLLGVDYGGSTALLAEAIKTLSAKVKALETEVAQLRGNPT